MTRHLKYMNTDGNKVIFLIYMYDLLKEKKRKRKRPRRGVRRHRPEDSGVDHSAARSLNLFFHSHFSSFSRESFVRCARKKKEKRKKKLAAPLSLRPLAAICPLTQEPSRRPTAACARPRAATWARQVAAWLVELAKLAEVAKF